MRCTCSTHCQPRCAVRRYTEGRPTATPTASLWRHTRAGPALGPQSRQAQHWLIQLMHALQCSKLPCLATGQGLSSHLTRMVHSLACHVCSLLLPPPATCCTMRGHITHVTRRQHTSCLRISPCMHGRGCVRVIRPKVSRRPGCLGAGGCLGWAWQRLCKP